MTKRDKFGIGVLECFLLVKSCSGVCFQDRTASFLERVLLCNLSDIKGHAINRKKTALQFPQSPSYHSKRFFEECFGVFRDQAILPGTIRHLFNAGVIDVMCGKALAKVLFDFSDSDILLIHFDIDLSEYLIDASCIGGCIKKELGEIFATKDRAQDIEDFITPKRGFDLLDLLKKLFQHLSLTSVLCHQIIDKYLSALPVSVNTTHALFETVGIPGHIVVDHEIAELEIDSFTSCLGSDHDLCSIFEYPLRIYSFFEPHPAMDGVNRITPRLYSFR